MGEVYETDDDYTFSQMRVFMEWFDKEIGTESEKNESASGELDQYYCMFFDLHRNEVQKIREKELELRKWWNKDE